MMFITPTPPTSSEIAAIPPSMIVRVSSTDVAASSTDASLAIEKSTFDGVGDAVEIGDERLRLLDRRPTRVSAEVALT